MMRKPLLIIAVCFFHLASAQTFSAAVDKQKILIGEQFHLELLAGFDKGKEAWVKMDSLPHFEILESSKIDTQEKEGRIVLSQIFLLTSWDSGQWTIPPILLGKMHSKPIRMDVAFSPSPFDVNQP